MFRIFARFWRKILTLLSMKKINKCPKMEFCFLSHKLQQLYHPQGIGIQDIRKELVYFLSFSFFRIRGDDKRKYKTNLTVSLLKKRQEKKGWGVTTSSRFFYCSFALIFLFWRPGGRYILRLKIFIVLSWDKEGVLVMEICLSFLFVNSIQKEKEVVLFFENFSLVERKEGKIKNFRRNWSKK